MERDGNQVVLGGNAIPPEIYNATKGNHDDPIAIIKDALLYGIRTSEDQEVQRANKYIKAKQVRSETILIDDDSAGSVQEVTGSREILAINFLQMQPTLGTVEHDTSG